MRCKNCGKTTKNILSSSWEKWQICFVCACKLGKMQRPKSKGPYKNFNPKTLHNLKYVKEYLKN